MALHRSWRFFDPGSMLLVVGPPQYRRANGRRMSFLSDMYRYQVDQEVEGCGKGGSMDVDDPGAGGRGARAGGDHVRVQVEGGILGGKLFECVFGIT